MIAEIILMTMQRERMHMDLSHYTQDQMILRDYLALERTVLASERTLLAYIRTAIGTFASGVGMLKLIESTVFTVIGYIFIVISPLAIIIGIINYLSVRRLLKIKKSSNNDLSDY